MACLFISQTGCSVWQQARRTLISEPSAFSWKWDRSRSLKVYRRWADEAWLAERGGCPDVAGDADYALGFRDGFVDYIYAGGNGEPPPTPPRQYWNVAMRGPDGKAAAAQWFAGYRHGASVARAGGLRENGVVASSYAWGAAVAGDYPLGAHSLGELGPASELLPVPLENGESEDLSDPTLGAPEFTLPEPSAVDAEEPVEPAPPANESGIDEVPSVDSAVPIGTRPVDAAEEKVHVDDTPDALSEPEFELESPTARATSSRRERSTRAVERFRRAVTTVQFVEPSSTK